MAAATSELRGLFRKAKGARSISELQDGDLLQSLEAIWGDAYDSTEGGQLAASSANGRSIGIADPSPYTVTPTQKYWAADEAISIYKKAKRFLHYCGKNGLDPVATEAYEPTPGQLPAGPAVQYKEGDVYEWVMGSEEAERDDRFWPGMLLPDGIRECRSDYGAARLSAGTQFT